jgi:hypothetical protein
MRRLIRGTASRPILLFLALGIAAGAPGARGQAPVEISRPGNVFTPDGQISAQALGYECAKKSALCTGYIDGYMEALRFAVKFADQPGVKLRKIGCYREVSVGAVASSMVDDLKTNHEHQKMGAWQELGMILVGIPCTTD